MLDGETPTLEQFLEMMGKWPTDYENKDKSTDGKEDKHE